LPRTLNCIIYRRMPKEISIAGVAVEMEAVPKTTRERWVGQLPRTLREIADRIGLEAVWGLVDHYGGVRLQVPLRLDPDHHLVRNLGLEAAQALHRHFRQEQLYIPRATSVRRQMRDARICERYAAGATARELAIEHQLSERQIWAITGRGARRRGPRSPRPLTG